MHTHYLFPELSDLKKVRERAGLKQSSLSKLSGVSQSIISKTEKGDRIPRYTTIVRLFKAISVYMSKQAGDVQTIASAVMKENVLSFEVDASVGEVIYLMKEKDISQFPVYENGALIGTVTERSLLGADPRDAIRDFLEDILPILSQNTTTNSLERILKLYSAVLLSDGKGNIVGICSRQDILDY